MKPNDHHLDLLDSRRRVHEMYAAVRGSQADPKHTHQEFVQARDRLFADHPQSPLSQDQRSDFGGLAYYDYDPGWRLLVELDFGVDHADLRVELEEDGQVTMSRIARARFTAGGAELELSLFWLQGYAGGLFLPFRDNTNKGITYGGGRYLLDSAKGADLGAQDGRLVVDFNYAYNPSCAYNPRWHCPLAPPENWLNHSIPAGERRYPGAMPRARVDDAILTE